MSLEQMRLKPEEIEINIPRLLKACLKNVKWILIIAMIVAIILSSYKFIKDKEEYNSEIELMRDITEEQTEKVKETIEEYYDIKDNYDYLVDYEKNALIMKFDYRNLYKGELQYGIRAEQEIKKDIAIVLKNYLVSAHFINAFSQKIDGKDQLNLHGLFENVSAEEGVVTINVIAPTKEKCKAYIKIIKELLEEKSVDIQRLGAFELILLESQISLGDSYDVAVLQQQIINNRKNGENTLKEYVSTLTQIEKRFLVEKGEDEELIDYVEKSSPRFSIKFTIIGFMIGLILGILFVVTYVVFSGRIQTSDEIEKRFGFTKIQVFNKKEIKKQVDKSISIIIKKILEDGKQTVGIISTMHKERLFGIEELVSGLEKENIKCIVLEDVIKDKDKIKRIEEGIPVILLETIGTSKVNALYEEVSLCEQENIKVLGYICVEE